MGHSLGGCLSAFIAADSSPTIIYDGICFVAPYFDVYDRRLLDKLEPVVKMIYKVTPDKKVNIADRAPKRHLEQWMNDPINQGSTASPHNIMQNIKVMRDIKEKGIMTSNYTPSLVIRGGKDTVVCNKAIQ